MSKQDVLNLVGDTNKTKFEEELSLNGDTDTTTWYKVYFPHIEVKHSTRGNEKTSNDVYVFAYPSLNVYYLASQIIGSETYFSLSSKFPDIKNVQGSENIPDTSNVTIQKSSGINAEYSNAIWTNDLKVKITTELVNDEELYIKVTDKGTEKKITTTTGSNTLAFSNIQSLMNKTSSLIADITQTDKNNLYSVTSQNKYFEIIKRKSGAIIGSIKIPASNIDEIPPVILYNSYYASHNTDEHQKENIALFRYDVSDSESGVKDIRIVYIQSRSLGIDITNMLTDSKLSEDYILKNGIKVKYEGGNGSVDVKLPADVDYVIAVTDGAGNMSQFCFRRT